MENQKYPINNNPTNSSNASSSGTNSMEKDIIELAEKEAKKAEFKAKYSTIYNDYLNKKISYNKYYTELLNLREPYQPYLTKNEILTIRAETESEWKLPKNELGEEEREQAEREWQRQQAERQTEFQAAEEELTKKNQELVKEIEELDKKRQILREKDRELEIWEGQINDYEKSLQLAIKNKAVYTTGENSKAVIKAEVSQELTAIKESFENIKINETSEARINYKVNKEVDKLKNSWDKQNLVWNAFSVVPFVGNIAAPIHAAEHSKKLEAALKKQVKENFPEIVKKLVNEATVDLEKQKNKAVKKIDALIIIRDEEVKTAQEAILTMEKVISEIKEQYQTLENQKNNEIEGLKKLSEEEIAKLQEEIGKILATLKTKENEVKELKDKGAKYENWLKEKSARRMKTNETTAPKVGIIDKDTEIAKLRETIEDLKHEAGFFENSRNHTRLELENAKKEIQAEKNFRETTETNLKNQAEREATRLKNVIADKEAEIERVKIAWQEKHDRLKIDRDNWKQRYNKIRIDWDNEDTKSEELEAKNKNLKIDKNTLENKVRELEETIKGLQPSWAYQMADKIGLVKLKNAGVNIILLFGLLAIIYAISLVLKYIAKPAWLNLAGFFPKSKKRKVIAVEAEEEEEEEEAEEEIFEVEPKPKRSKKSKGITKQNQLKKQE